jgi:NAD(P)-dependent dehydrogenase (short-subunit alcohol dehydrogenase family)
VAGLNADVVDYPLDEWKRVFDVNINGLFYCNRYVGLLMKARAYGRIVNISSVAGKEGNPRASAYSASKAAVIGFIKSFGNCARQQAGAYRLDGLGSAAQLRNEQPQRDIENLSDL